MVPAEGTPYNLGRVMNGAGGGNRRTPPPHNLGRVMNGAGGGNRTHTPVKAADFESAASTSSATPAHAKPSATVTANWQGLLSMVKATYPHGLV
jgi:hypothetical protein